MGLFFAVNNKQCGLTTDCQSRGLGLTVRVWAVDHREYEGPGPQIKNGSRTLGVHCLGKDLTPTTGEELKDHGIAAWGEQGG